MPAGSLLNKEASIGAQPLESGFGICRFTASNLAFSQEDWSIMQDKQRSSLITTQKSSVVLKPASTAWKNNEEKRFINDTGL